MPFSGQVEVQLKCSKCGAITYVNVDKLAWNKYWWSGKGASEHFSNLSKKELDFLISGVCWNCSTVKG